MNKIAVIGSGYVGLVSGTCLADFGREVTCVDNDVSKIDNLRKGIIPIYEPGLDDLVKKNMGYKRLAFDTDIGNVIKNNNVIFIAVGTPPAEDGSADLHYVMQVAEDIGKNINSYKVIVDKSTVPIGTGKLVKDRIIDIMKSRGVAYEFDVVSNPEFLREGTALQDFMHPDRVVIGTESKRALEIMRDIYRVLHLNDIPFVETNIETAEMIKYASNSFLATKITFINELTELCEKVGADIQYVTKGMGLDSRISNKFLNAGPGFGGSCFPKDTRALVSIARDHGSDLSIINAAVVANEKQKLRVIDRIVSAMGEVDNRIIGVLGLSFKPNTDDMREAPSITILNNLAARGAKFRVFDPEAHEEAKWRLRDISDSITYCGDEYEAVQAVDAVVIITEWNQFRNLDLNKMKDSMRGNFFFDLRNIYVKGVVEEFGYKYFGVGR